MCLSINTYNIYGNDSYFCRNHAMTGLYNNERNLTK